MSFTSTPLGQGRRLDHHTFLNKPNSNHNRPPNPPPLRAIPTSYAYGASSLNTRSPPKADRTNQPSAHADPDGPQDDSNEPALVRFARLKQIEQEKRGSGPRVITSPPRPEKWAVKDTSVNIASAFNQAVTSADLDSSMPPTSMTPNDTWASATRNPPVLPRSTSVEYEKETQSTVNRRLAPPPNRRAVRPVSKQSSVRHVPGSEGEDEESQEMPRGKSPFEHILDISKRLAPTQFLMRQRSQEPEPTNGNTSHDRSASYDYSAEEREYQATLAQKPSSRRGTVTHKRNRMSTDNKAYRPTVSDLEETDEEVSDGGRRRRKKGKKNGATGGPLTTLPVAAYDKRRKKKRGTKGNGIDGEGSEDDSDESDEPQEFERVSEQVHRGTTPVYRPPSVSRDTRPPVSKSSITPREYETPPQFDSSHHDTSMDLEQNLEPIDEAEEDEYFDESDQPRPRASFSIGASLGRGVHWVLSLGSSLFGLVFRFVALVFALFGKALGASLDLLIVKPVQLLSSANPQPLYNLSKYAIVGLSIYAAWRASQNGWLDFRALPFPSSNRPTYSPPDVPASDISEIASRLQSLEYAYANLASDTHRSQTQRETDSRKHAEVISRLSALESRLHKESLRALDSETRLSATSESWQIVKKELEALSAQVQSWEEESRTGGSQSGSTSEEADAKLRALEERVGSVEGGVKEALELGKSAVKVGAPAGSAAAWWSKLASGSSSAPVVKIQSTDGQDVTSLLGHLVDAAVSRSSKDTLARPDFALYSGGAQLIPSLTSETFEIRPRGVLNQVAGLLTGGNGYAVGRPPVTALHHENHVGHCWPFPGSQGQLAVTLSAPVYISDVTIDHVAKEVATDLRSAPRQMELWGLVEGKDNLAKVREWRELRQAAREEEAAAAALEGRPYEDADPEPVYPPSLPKRPEYVRVANFTYNIHSPEHIQTFPARQDIRDLGIDFGVVVLVVKSNWGMDEYTCLYRLRVHGDRMGELPAPLSEEWAQ